MNKYEKVALEIGNLLEEKGKKYGNSFSRSGFVLRELYPNGISLNQYDDMLAIIRIIDKFFRIANNNIQDEEDPWRDIAGYSILCLEKNLNKKRNK